MATRKKAGPERIQEDLQALAVDIDDPILDPRNAREHPEENLDQIKLSLLTYGQCKPVVINKHSGIIEAGNGMLQAARELGWRRIAVARADHDPRLAAGYGIMDNKSGLSSTWNLPVLKDTLQELDTGDFDMRWTGFSDAEIEALMLQEHQGVTLELKKNDDVAPEKAPERVQEGEVWVLGRHRLICGDASDPGVLKRLLDGAALGMVFADPPYGIKSVGSNGHIGGGSKTWGGRQGYGVHRFRQVVGDATQLDLTFLLDLAPAVLIWGGNYYAPYLPPGGIWLVWDKQRLGEHTFSDCELVWTNLPGVTVKKYEFMWAGYSRQGSRAEELVSRVHPNQKAVAVCAQMMLDYGAPGQAVLDPFGGSGTTVIACEKINRPCYVAEIDRLYCDIIIKRFQDYAGVEAKKLAPGGVA